MSWISFILLFFMCALQNLQAEEPFRVGAVLALTGPVSIQGVPMQNAMLLAKEELDKEGLLEIIFEDDGFQPKNAVTGAKKLIGQDQVQALTVFGTNQGLGVVGLTEKSKIPFLSINVNRNVVRDRDYAVFVMPSVQDLTAVNIDESRRRGYKRIATVATIQDACLLQRDILRASGVAEMVADLELIPADREFRDSALRVLKSKPDAVFLSTLNPHAALFSKRLRSLGYRGEFFGAIQAASLSQLKLSEGALKGAWIVAGEDRYAVDYYKSYRKRFGSDPTALSIYAYDAVKLILEGVKSGNLNTYLHTVKGAQGVAGKYDADGKNGFTYKVVAKEFTADGYRYLEERE